MSKARDNNFYSEDGREKAVYKLWLAIHPNYQYKWKGRKTHVYYGSNQRRNKGLDWLMEKAKSLRTEITVAKIYHNQSGEELYNIPGTDTTYSEKQSNFGI